MITPSSDEMFAIIDKLVKQNDILVIVLFNLLIDLILRFDSDFFDFEEGN
jgi:hypothetical protein